MNNQDNDGIDLGSAPVDDAFDPFATDEELSDEAKPEPAPEQKSKSTKPSAPAADNPLDAAIDTAETKEAEKSQRSLFEKSPVFEYAGVSEDIGDTAKTFDELRIEKAADFPELEDGKRVTWTVEYGKITKSVPDAKGTSVGKMKSDIETSKEFLEALKKARDKAPACRVKPRVTAQNKGAESSYNGVFTSQEAAESSGKAICLFPARNGNVYEMRNTPMGRFITKTRGNDILSEVKAGFTPALPRIPHELLVEIISFFRLMAHEGDYEALVNIYWDIDEQKFILDAPIQTVTQTSIESKITAYDGGRYIHYMDIHSHPTMSAVFSDTDDRNEKATRVYAVVGRVLSYFPEFSVRISCGGNYQDISPSTVFEGFGNSDKFSFEWKNRIKFVRTSESLADKYTFDIRGCDSL